MKKKTINILVFAFIALSLWVAITKFSNSNSGITGMATLEKFEEEINFYKGNQCRCCDVYSSYMQNKGKLNLNVIELNDISFIKEDRNIPPNLRSCHTSIIGNYFIEGHIPLEAIGKLMEEKPDIAGIALPGMPLGSPGMPGMKVVPFVIYAVNHDGSYSEFMIL